MQKKLISKNINARIICSSRKWELSNYYTRKYLRKVSHDVKMYVVRKSIPTKIFLMTREMFRMVSEKSRLKISYVHEQ